jgi:N-acetylgalactosamine-N,N'-diacetylbacillosaminyl-diphospho-undecaprenol 4-alpha-N-acetylgalactosaminyltransferase
MKKIAVFIINLRGGGAERIVSYLLNEGYKEFEFHLILFSKEMDYPLPQSENIKIIELGKYIGSKYLSILAIPYLAYKLKKYLVKNNIQTILSLLNRPNIISCYLKKHGWKGKVIISERADSVTYYKSLYFGSFIIGLIKWYYPYADIISVISKGIAHNLKTLGIHNCKVIYNPIPISWQSPKQQLPKKYFTFINIARLEQQKNHKLLLNAFAKLKNENCKLVMVGQGRLMDSLKNLSIKLGIENKVNFAGFQSNIESYLEDADCFVFTSDFEGLGNVLIEALNAGLPIISTDCPYGPREVLAPDTDERVLIQDHIEQARYGLLTPVRSMDHLVDAMRKMMADDSLRNKYHELALERASDFDIKKIARQYFEMF